jgi:Cytochrome P450
LEPRAQLERYMISIGRIEELPFAPLPKRALTTECTAIASYQDRINRQIKVLMKNLSDSAAAKRPVIINEVMYWFAFDSMGEFAFNQDFGMMRRQEWHFAVTLFRRAISIVGPFAPTIWLIKVGFTFLPWFWKIGDWFMMLAFCKQQMDKRLQVRR